MYSVLALDLDGTLTNAKKQITPKTKDAVQRARQAGCHIVLASGRPLLGIEHVATSLDLMGSEGTILAYNGGQLFDTRTKQVLWERSVDIETIRTCFSYARAHKLASLSYDEVGIITEMDEDPYVGKEAYNNAIPIRKVSNLINEVSNPMPKVMIVGEPARLQKAREDLSLLVGDEADLGFSEPCFMEITAKGVQKASSLLVLLSLLKKGKDSLMVIGDGFNDVPMFSVASLAVAMENASDEVKAYAHVITESNEHDGVALAIEQYILTKQQ
ncbi:MAG: Cof-type HAD-IIB family hydrolase [Sphaerochaeta sp.]